VKVFNGWATLSLPTLPGGRAFLVPCSSVAASVSTIGSCGAVHQELNARHVRDKLYHTRLVINTLLKPSLDTTILGVMRAAVLLIIS
jgi:hypothetical protein